METRRWFNSSQPQPLQLAVVLLYTNAVFALLGGFLQGATGFILLAFIAGYAASAFGIANERKWGYYLGLACAWLPLILQLYLTFHYHVIAVGAISLLLEVALIVALLHSQSRSYRKIWFR